MLFGYIIDIPIFSLFGCVFIIGLGAVMLASGVEVKTGLQEVYVYGNNFTGYHWDYDGTQPAPKDLEGAYLFHKNETTVYAPYDFGGVGNTTFAFLVMLLGVILFVLFLFTIGDD